MADYAGYRYSSRQGMKIETCVGGISPLPADYTVAMLYVPIQTDTAMFDEMKALECGTLFPVLSKPFAGKCCK